MLLWLTAHTARRKRGGVAIGIAIDHKAYCQAQASMVDKIADNVIEFSCSNGLNNLRIHHDYLPLKRLAKGKPTDDKTTATTLLAPVPEKVVAETAALSLSSERQQAGARRGGEGGLASMSSALSSVSSFISAKAGGGSASKRGPPREPPPAITATHEQTQDVGRALEAARSSAGAVATVSRQVKP